MKISTMQELLEAKVLCCEENLGKHVYSACGCDLMSDVLAYVKDQAVLLTGLINSQVIRTAVMMDMLCIVFVRSKEPSEEMLTLARESGIVVMTTEKRLYEACGLLYSNGLVGKTVKRT
ncbi:MAG: hypothetical protein IJD51_00990 [Clostridia bacterium]|nr:hypothetical protein [Clostridia bacterium]